MHCHAVVGAAATGFGCVPGHAPRLLATRTPRERPTMMLGARTLPRPTAGAHKPEWVPHPPLPLLPRHEQAHAHTCRTLEGGKVTQTQKKFRRTLPKSASCETGKFLIPIKYRNCIFYSVSYSFKPPGAPAPNPQPRPRALMRNPGPCIAMQWWVPLPRDSGVCPGMPRGSSRRGRRASGQR